MLIKNVKCLILIVIIAGTSLLPKAASGGWFGLWGDKEDETKAAAKADSSTRGRIVIFASEELGKNWIRSYFNTVPESVPSYNECELALNETLSMIGFGKADGEFTPEQKDEARRLMPVFGRYRDMSTMANGTAVKAAKIVDPSADAVVLCTVGSDKKVRWKRAGNIKSCAAVDCKAVSLRNSTRLATHTWRKCVEAPEDQGLNVELIRSMCREAGRGLGEKLGSFGGKTK